MPNSNELRGGTDSETDRGIEAPNMDVSNNKNSEISNKTDVDSNKDKTISVMSMNNTRFCRRRVFKDAPEFNEGYLNSPEDILSFASRPSERKLTLRNKKKLVEIVPLRVPIVCCLFVIEPFRFPNQRLAKRMKSIRICLMN